MASSRPHFAISSDQTFHMLDMRHMLHMCLPSSIPNTVNVPRVQD